MYRESGINDVEIRMSGDLGRLSKRSIKNDMRTIYLAGGCFWGTQKFFDQFDGVKRTSVGYANGEKENPSYEEVCNNSGHAETVKVDYDESVISTR